MLVNCRNCKNEFDKKPAEVRRTKHHYCSKKCKGSFLKKASIDDFYGNINIDAYGCWNWQGSINGSGYGVKRFKGKVALAHRVSYQISRGEIGDHHVLHRCDNTACVNPEHLFLGSHTDNMHDMIRKGRKWSKLSFDDVSAIRSSGISNSDLAKKFQVSERTIRYAKNANNWMPLPEPPND